MPGGKYDSSKTRVVPVFDQLSTLEADWPRRLLALAEGPGNARRPLGTLDLTFKQGWWGTHEKGLRPPIGLLSWLIRNPRPLAEATEDESKRARLLGGDPDAIEEALTLLRTTSSDREWFIYEGRTYPDAVIETPDALIVIEGKRTEALPTTSTKWMPGRHQIWRHIDAAWEIRGRREVFGLFVVEGGAPCFAVPPVWSAAVQSALGEGLAPSFPHRGMDELASISRCLLGATTWQSVCAAFGLDFGCLPHTTDDCGQQMHGGAGSN